MQWVGCCIWLKRQLAELYDNCSTVIVTLTAHVKADIMIAIWRMSLTLQPMSTVEIWCWVKQQQLTKRAIAHRVSATSSGPLNSDSNQNAPTTLMRLKITHPLRLGVVKVGLPYDSVLSVLSYCTKWNVIIFLTIIIVIITSCGAKAQQTKSPCCASRHHAVSRNWPKM